MLSDTTRGGKREGAGRKPAPIARHHKITVYLDDNEAYWCQVLSKSSVARGARMVLDGAFKRLAPDKEYDSLRGSPSQIE